MKYLLLLVAVLILVWWLRRPAAGGRRPDPSSDVSANKPMVRCAQCGLHLPRDEAVEAGGDFFCSDAHRRLMQGPDA